MQKSGAKAYLVNTGWNGTGKRISIKDTRGIIDAILSGAINEAPTKTIPYFGFEVPTALPGVDHRHPGPPRHLCRCRSVGGEGKGSGSAASSRTLLSTRATSTARPWWLPAPSCKLKTPV